MSDSPKKHLSKIRTFARDLDAVRTKNKPHADEPKKTPAPIRPIELSKSKKETLEESVSAMIPKKEVALPIPKITVPPPAPDKKSVIHTTIPAFHELKKHPEPILNKEDRKINIVSRHASKTSEITTPRTKNEQVRTITPIKKFVGGGGGGGGATIITDTKESSFKLFPSVFKSIENWFKTLALQHKKKKTPTYTVPETNRRKGVIQKATSKTGTIFTADNDTIKEQIRRRRLQEKEREAETSWSPFTETGYNLLEAPDEPTNIKVEFKKHAVAETETTAPAQIPVEPTPPPVITQLVEEVIPEPPAVITKKIEETVPSTPEPEEDTRWELEPIATTSAPEAEPVPVVENTPTIVLPEAIEETPEELIPELEEEPIYEELAPIQEVVEETRQKNNSSPTDFLRRLSQENTNTQTIIILMIVIGLVAMIFIVKFIFQYFTSTPPVTVVEIPKQELLVGATQIDLPFTVGADTSLAKQISEAVKTSQNKLVEISVVSPSGIEIASSQVFELMQFQTEPSLNQSINNTHFVSLNQSEPALLLGFTDEYTVRGGLLKWEANMGEDLYDLLSIEKNVNGGKFKDVSITGFDVRVLKNTDGSEIVYGIVNHNTVIITTSESKFSQIVNLGFAK